MNPSRQPEETNRLGLTTPLFRPQQLQKRSSQVAQSLRTRDQEALAPEPLLSAPKDLLATTRAQAKRRPPLEQSFLASAGSMSKTCSVSFLRGPKCQSRLRKEAIVGLFLTGPAGPKQKCPGSMVHTNSWEVVLGEPRLI